MPSIAQPADRDFEITFADLAHAQLRDKAPALLDYLLGFQVIDINEDQTHGIGVMGFKLGEQMLYVPSFFLNGELKQSLLYIKNQDLFVPLQDNWVTFLLNRRPHMLGEPESRRAQELGVSQPNFRALSNTLGGGQQGALFGTRYASYEPWAGDAIASMFERLGERRGKLESLPQFLKKTASYGTSSLLAYNLNRDPELAAAVLSRYPVRELMFKAAGGKAARRVSKGRLPVGWKSSATNNSALFDDPATQFNKSGAHRVKILHGQHCENLLLSNDDREVLLRGGVLFKDAREETNTAYKTDEGITLVNPTEPGEYKLLLSDGNYVDAFIIPAPKAIGDGYVRVALVIDKESKNFNYWWCNQLWTRPSTQSPSRRIAEADSVELSSITPNSTYTLIAKNGEASIAFTVARKVAANLTELFVVPAVTNPGGMKPSNKATAKDMARFGQGSNFPFVGDVVSNSSTATAGSCSCETADNVRDVPFVNLNHIVLSNNDRDMRVVGNTLFVPNTAKALKLSNGAKLDTWALADPSSLMDVEINLLKEGAEAIWLLRKGADIHVNNAGPFSRMKVITALVKKAGLRGPDATAMVDGLENDKRSRFLVKNAIGFAPPIPDPETGYDDYAQAMEQYPQEDNIPLNMPMGPEEAYLGKPDRQQIMEAVRLGQQDIFDTSSIASLVRLSDNSDLISKYLSDIMLGLDRVCRILFMFYWKNEQFRDKYGQGDMVELEDHLKSVAKSLGDLVLFLKQRQVRGAPEFDSTEIDLGLIGKR